MHARLGEAAGALGDGVLRTDAGGEYAVRRAGAGHRGRARSGCRAPAAQRVLRTLDDALALRALLRARRCGW